MGDEERGEGGGDEGTKRGAKKEGKKGEVDSGPGMQYGKWTGTEHTPSSSTLSIFRRLCSARCLFLICRSSCFWLSVNLSPRLLRVVPS